MPDQLVGGEFAYLVQPDELLAAVGARLGASRGVLARNNNLASDACLEVPSQFKKR